MVLKTNYFSGIKDKSLQVLHLTNKNFLLTKKKKKKDGLKDRWLLRPLKFRGDNYDVVCVRVVLVRKNGRREKTFAFVFRFFLYQ